MKFLTLESVMDAKLLRSIQNEGFSRFPVVIVTEELRFIFAILLSKSLIGLKPSKKTI